MEINFKIESIGKEYIAYSVNDDNVSEYENNIPKIVPIKEEEKEMILMFYNSIRNKL